MTAPKKPKIQWIGVNAVPPEVHLAMDILKLEPHDAYETIKVGAQRVIEHHLRSTTHDKANEPQPVVETCGECGNCNHRRGGFGQCMARGGDFTVPYLSGFAKGCKFATPDTPKAKEPTE